MADAEREIRLQRERQEKRKFHLLLQGLKLLSTLVVAVAWLSGGSVAGWTVVETARALEGKNTNAKIELIIESKMTKSLGVGSGVALGGAGGVYLRRRKRLADAKASGKRTL